MGEGGGVRNRLISVVVASALSNIFDSIFRFRKNILKNKLVNRFDNWPKLHL